MEAQKNQTTFGPLKQLWHSTKGNALLGVGCVGGSRVLFQICHCTFLVTFLHLAFQLAIFSPTAHLGNYLNLAESLIIAMLLITPLRSHVAVGGSLFLLTFTHVIFSTHIPDDVCLRLTFKIILSEPINKEIIVESIKSKPETRISVLSTIFRKSIKNRNTH